MTKAELIEMMSEYPDETMVVIRGFAEGQTCAIDVEWVKLKLTPRVEDPYEIDEGGDTDAIYLH
jgi:hypothetical protein